MCPLRKLSGALVLACWLAQPAKSDESTGENACRENLELLGAAYSRFLQMTEGKPPSSMSELYTQGLVLDLGAFTCPVSSNRITDPKQIDALSSYEITTKLDDKLPMLLFKEKHGLHGGQGLTLYSDRSVRKIAAPAPAGPAIIPETNANPTALVQTNQNSRSGTPTSAPLTMVTNADGTASLALTNAQQQAAFFDYLGKEHSAKGRWADAEKAFGEAAAREPTNLWHHYNLGMALGQQQHWKEAEVSYQKAVRIDPNHAPTHFYLGYALAYQTKWREAESAYETAAKLDPQDARYRYALGVAQRGQMKWSAAENSFREAIRLDPRNPANYVELGNVLGQQNKWSDAETPYREAARLDPKNSWAHGGMGHVYLSQAKFGEAETSYRQAVLLNPQFAQFHADLAAVLFQLNRRPEAAEAAQQAILLGYKTHWVYGALGLKPPN